MTTDEALDAADHGGLTPKDTHDAAVVLAAEVRRLRGDDLPLCSAHMEFAKSHHSECFGCDLAAARAEIAKLKAWPRCDDCGAELVEADVMQDKVCLLCEWKGKAGAARAEAARLRDLIDAAKNVMLSFYQRAPIEVQEWLDAVEERDDPR